MASRTRSERKVESAWRRHARYWLRRDTMRRAIGVAAVVGPILTVINQPEAILEMRFPPRVLLKIALTFLVPYAVSSYSSARALSQAELDRASMAAE